MILFILGLLFIAYFVVVFFINDGAFQLGKFRLVKRYVRVGGKKEVWVIQEKLLWFWWRWNCIGEYWDGKYDNYEEAKKDFDQLTKNKKPQEIIHN